MRSYEPLSVHSQMEQREHAMYQSLPLHSARYEHRCMTVRHQGEAAIVRGNSITNTTQLDIVTTFCRTCWRKSLSGLERSRADAVSLRSGMTEMTMRAEMKREQIGSAISQPKCSTSRDEIITPTLPKVSASTWRNSPIQHCDFRVRRDDHVITFNVAIVTVTMM